MRACRGRTTARQRHCHDPPPCHADDRRFPGPSAGGETPDGPIAARGPPGAPTRLRGLRRPRALSHAGGTTAVSRGRRRAQPTPVRAYTSNRPDRDTQPSAVHLSVLSPAQACSGLATAPWRARPWSAPPSSCRRSVVPGPRARGRRTDTPAAVITRRACARPTDNPSAGRCVALRRLPSRCRLSQAMAGTLAQSATVARALVLCAGRRAAAENPRRRTGIPSHTHETGQIVCPSAIPASLHAPRWRKQGRPAARSRAPSAAACVRAAHEAVLPAPGADDRCRERRFRLLAPVAVSPAAT